MSELSEAKPDWRGGMRGKKRRPILRIVLLSFLGISGLAVLALIIWWQPISKRLYARAATVQAGRIIDASSMTAPEKIEAKQVFEKFVKEILAERMPKEKWQAIRSEADKGIIGQMGRIAAIAGFVEASKLSDAEKQDGIKTLNLFLSGYVQGKITEEELVSVARLAPIDEQGDVIAPKEGNEEELKKILAAADGIVKDRKIEITEQKPDFAPEIRRLVGLMKEAME